MRYDPLAGTMAPPSAPAKPARARRTNCGPVAPPKPPTADKSTRVRPPAAPRGKTVDVRSIPLTTFACLLGDASPGYDVLAEWREQFAAFCDGHPAADWRANWRAFRQLPPPPADAVPAANIVPLPATPAEPSPEPPAPVNARTARAFLQSL